MAIDPNHSQVRETINVGSLILLIAGILCFVTGICLFLSTFFTSSSSFFADPDGVMDSDMHHAVIGMVLFAAGAIMGSIGSKGLFFANVGRIARYGAAEITPVARDVLQDMTPVISETVREVAAAAHSGMAAGANQATTHYCPNCGAAIGEGAHFCENCGTRLHT